MFINIIIIMPPFYGQIIIKLIVKKNGPPNKDQKFY